MMSTDGVQAEIDRKRLEAEIASLQNEIEETASRVPAADACSVGSLSTIAKRVVVRRVVRKVRPKKSSGQFCPLLPVDETPQAVEDARSAEQHRQQLEREIAAMEQAIALQRRHHLKRIVDSTPTKVNVAIRQPDASRRSPLSPSKENTQSTETQHDTTREGQRHDSQTPPRAGLMPSLLESIAQAASARDQRVENGEVIQREHVPEVAAPKATTPQLSFDLAEMVSKAARDREHRLENGGESKMRTVPTREDWKGEFKNVVVEAAQLGRLTRLREHVVEATATEKTPEQVWRSQGLLAIQWRSNHMSVIHEAALAGAASKLPEKVVSNFHGEQSDVDYEDQIHGKAMSPRMRQLLELNQRVGAGQHKVDKLVLGRKEERGVDSLIVKPMWCYSNVDDVVLPKEAPPKLNLEERRREMAKRPMIDISNEAATKAWERRARLDRPNVLPKMKEQCNCCWCGTASPFQTYAYKLKDLRKKHGEVEDGLAMKHQQEVERFEGNRRKAERLKRQSKDGVEDPESCTGGRQVEDVQGDAASAISDDVSLDQSTLSSDSKRVSRRVRKVRRVPKDESNRHQLRPELDGVIPASEGQQESDQVGLFESQNVKAVEPSPPETAPVPPLNAKPVATQCACIIL